MVDISVVLPCYRAAPLARRSVEELRALFADLPHGSWEVVVVDDGGGDFDPAAWPADGTVRLVTLPRNRGKGAAVAAGMAAARGRARIYTDVDLPYEPALIRVAAEYLLNRGFHMVIGDRTLPSSSYRGEIGRARALLSGISSTLIGRFVTGGFFDTQCGFKGIRGDVADRLFPLLRLTRFAFDAELVYLALIHRLDLKRVPVRLRENQTSTVRVFRDSAQAAFDLLRIKFHRMRGDYACPALVRMLEAEFRQVRAAVGAPLPEPAPAAPAAAPWLDGAPTREATLQYSLT